MDCGESHRRRVMPPKPRTEAFLQHVFNAASRATGDGCRGISIDIMRYSGTQLTPTLEALRELQKRGFIHKIGAGKSTQWVPVALKFQGNRVNPDLF